MKSWLEKNEIEMFSNMYIDFNKENNKDFPTFKVVDHVKPSFCQ